MNNYAVDYSPTMDEVGDYLYHHGIKGQHWGVRRYQNPDGSLTPEGRARYRSALADNVISRGIKGAKIGTAVGAGLGVAAAGIMGAGFVAAGVPVAAIAGSALATVGSSAVSTMFTGLQVGAIVGAIKTGNGKKWAKKNLGVE